MGNPFEEFPKHPTDKQEDPEIENEEELRAAEEKLKIDGEGAEFEAKDLSFDDSSMNIKDRSDADSFRILVDKIKSLDVPGASIRMCRKGHKYETIIFSSFDISSGILTFINSKNLLDSVSLDDIIDLKLLKHAIDREKVDMAIEYFDQEVKGNGDYIRIYYKEGGEETVKVTNISRGERFFSAIDNENDEVQIDKTSIRSAGKGSAIDDTPLDNILKKLSGL